MIIIVRVTSVTVKIINYKQMKYSLINYRPFKVYIFDRENT